MILIVEHHVVVMPSLQDKAGYHLKYGTDEDDVSYCLYEGNSLEEFHQVVQIVHMTSPEYYDYVARMRLAFTVHPYLETKHLVVSTGRAIRENLDITRALNDKATLPSGSQRHTYKLLP